MGNIIVSVLAAPDKHEQILKEVNTWKYEIEGEVAKGKISPVINEVRTYEVRIPDEIEGEFVRDFCMRDHSNMFGTTNSLRTKLLYWLYKFVMRFTPFKKVDFSLVGTTPKYGFPGTWHYAVPIGKLKRKKMEVKFGEDREVL
jgi:hypothetical protein